MAERREEPELLDLEEENGLLPEEVVQLKRLTDLCEANVRRFDNDHMSQALVLVEALRSRWARVNGVACAFAQEAAEFRIAAKERAAEGWWVDEKETLETGFGRMVAIKDVNRLVVAFARPEDAERIAARG